MQRFRPISGELWPGPPLLPVGSDCLGALVAAADRCSTRDTAVLEGALRCGVRPTPLPAECFHTATGWAEHGDLDGLAFCLESGGDVEQVLGGAGHVVVFCMWLLYHIWRRRQPQASSSSISSISAVSMRPSIQRTPSAVI